MALAVPEPSMKHPSLPMSLISGRDRRAALGVMSLYRNAAHYPDVSQFSSRGGLDCCRTMVGQGVAKRHGLLAKARRGRTQDKAPDLPTPAMPLEAS